MTQHYKIKVSNDTAAFYYEQGRVYTGWMNANSVAGMAKYAYKWLYGDDHGMKTTIVEVPISAKERYTVKLLYDKNGNKGLWDNVQERFLNQEEMKLLKGSLH